MKEVVKKIKDLEVIHNAKRGPHEKNFQSLFEIKSSYVILIDILDMFEHSKIMLNLDLCFIIYHFVMILSE